jgi:hypothetical protein
MNVKITFEEGFVDFALPVKNMEVIGQERHITLEGIFEDKSVGLQIILPVNMKAGISSDSGELKIINTYQASMNSVGTESNDFLKMVSNLYTEETSGIFSKNPIQFTLLPMLENDFDIEKQTVITKIFFDKSEKYYSELFLNFEIANGYIQFSEKDQGYKNNIIKVFQGDL